LDDDVTVTVDTACQLIAKQYRNPHKIAFKNSTYWYRNWQRI